MESVLSDEGYKRGNFHKENHIDDKESMNKIINQQLLDASLHSFDLIKIATKRFLYEKLHEIKTLLNMVIFSHKRILLKPYHQCRYYDILLKHIERTQ